MVKSIIFTHQIEVFCSRHNEQAEPVAMVTGLGFWTHWKDVAPPCVDSKYIMKSNNYRARRLFKSHSSSYPADVNTPQITYPECFYPHPP